MRRTNPVRGEQIRAIAAWCLVGLGLASFVGYVSRSNNVRRWARSALVSPLPLAFSDSRSLRAFVDHFSAELVMVDGTRLRREVDASIYAALPGPYERHVIYGAAISLSPIMPLPIFRGILRYGFCDRGPLATAMGIDQPLRQAVLSIPTTLIRRTSEGAGRVLVSCGG